MSESAYQLGEAVCDPRREVRSSTAAECGGAGDWQTTSTGWRRVPDRGGVDVDRSERFLVERDATEQIEVRKHLAGAQNDRRQRILGELNR